MSVAILKCPPPDPNPRKPALRVPPFACDCHAHVIGPAHHFVQDRSYTPPDALLTDYLHVLRTLGMQRAVLVQPSMHGTDNSAILDAIASLDPLRDPEMRAVAVVRPDVSDKELEALHARGVRGIRLNLIYSGGGSDLRAANHIARRIRDLGWHIQILVNVTKVENLVSHFSGLCVPLVVDHMGHLPAALGPANPGFQALLELIKGGNTWVKLSGPYRLSAQEVPYLDVLPLVEALIRTAPDRLVWGTDWPHTVCQLPMPNDGDLMDLLALWVPDENVRNRILVDNPQVLYGFSHRP